MGHDSDGVGMGYEAEYRKGCLPGRERSSLCQESSLAEERRRIVEAGSNSSTRVEAGSTSSTRVEAKSTSSTRVEAKSTSSTRVEADSTSSTRVEAHWA